MPTSMQKCMVDIKVKVHKHTMPHPPIHHFTLVYTTNVRRGFVSLPSIIYHPYTSFACFFGMPSIHLLVSALLSWWYNV